MRMGLPNLNFGKTMDAKECHIWMPLHATRIADQRLLNMFGGKCRSALSRASVASCALTKNVATVGLRPLSCSPGRPLPTSHPEVKKCEAQQVSRQLLYDLNFSRGYEHAALKIHVTLLHHVTHDFSTVTLAWSSVLLHVVSINMV